MIPYWQLWIWKIWFIPLMSSDLNDWKNHNNKWRWFQQIIYIMREILICKLQKDVLLDAFAEFCCNKWSNFPSLALLSCAIFVAFSFLVSFPSCTCRLTTRLCTSTYAMLLLSDHTYQNKFIFHWASQNPPCPFFIIIIVNEVRLNGLKS